MRYPLLAGLLLLACQGASAQDQPFPGIEKLMSAGEYQAAGLDKLSPEEREALNKWLISYTVKDAPALLQYNEEVKAAEAAIEIVARIKPPFKGWTGKTVFYLDNGQVWRQRLDGRYPYNGDDTEVVITKNMFGYFKMTHTSTGRAVGVARIK